MAEPSHRSTVRAAAGRTALAALLIAPAVGAGCGDDAPPAEAVHELASCTPTAPDESDAAQPVRIVVTHMQNGTRELALNALIAEFDEANPDIEVLPDPWRDGAGPLMERWREQELAERPALSLLPIQLLGLVADSGQTVAPGECLRELVPDLLPSVEETWSVGGSLRAVPFAVSTPLLYYNRYLFREAGLDQDHPPTTFDEVLELAPALMAGPAQKAYVLETGADSSGTWYVEQMLAKAGEPSLLPDNGRGPDGPAERVNWGSPAAIDTLLALRTLYENDQAVWVRRNSGGREDLERAGRPGEMVAMTTHASAALGELIDVLEGRVDAAGAEFDGERIDLATAPLVGPGSGSLVGGDALWITDGMSERETDAAWRLAAWLASPEVDARWAAETGYVPVSESAARQPVLLDEWRAHPETRTAYDVLVDQPTTPEALGPVAGPLPELREVLAGAVEDIVLRHAEPEDRLAEAAEEADALLAAYNETQARRG